MTTVILMTLASIFLICGIIMILTTNHKWTSAVLICSPIWLSFAAGYKYNKNSIDVPEEYKEISKDKSKPDTLLGYYRNDTLVIEFKTK